MKELFARRSIRKYLDTPVTPEQIERLLRAGMAAPSAGDGREWSFLVVQSQEGKEKFMSAHDASGAVKTAPLLIMVCARFREEVYAPEGFWVQDCAAAIENMLIEATYLGLGSLWMAIYPRQHRIARIRTLFGIPEEVIPFGAVAIGVPARGKPPIDRYMADYVYLERYGQRLDGR